jgi:MbtH protein
METEQTGPPAEPQYSVVVNDEEQYSIWPLSRPVPAGWRPDGTTGSEAACVAHIDEVWVDMRPRSVRLAAEQSAAGS